MIESGAADNMIASGQIQQTISSVKEPDSVVNPLVRFESVNEFNSINNQNPFEFLDQLGHEQTANANDVFAEERKENTYIDFLDDII